ncbi:PRP38 family protein [Stagonosporopsis vannaccii]|nr:PRP38 family protein [Stagonosporopsis vannaccii]
MSKPAYDRADASALLDDRGYSGLLIRGQNPALLFEKGVRERITESYYWKEQCFGLNAATLCDRAVELKFIGGTTGITGRPTPFLCLAFKMLQLVPEKDVVLEMLNFRGDDDDEDEGGEVKMEQQNGGDEEAKKTDLNAEGKLGTFKYLRCLAAFYIRLAWEPVDIYTTLEPLLTDYRKIKRRLKENFSLTYVDQFVDDLLTKDRICATSLWKLPSRANLEDLDLLEPRESPLGDEVDMLDAEEERTKREASVGSEGTLSPKLMNYARVSSPEMASHFLGLPRELRDIIYSFLGHSLTFEETWQYKHSHMFVTVKGAPLLQLLLVNAQVHDEYTQATSCSAQIAIDSLGPFRIRDCGPRLRHILTKHVRSITLIIDRCIACFGNKQRNHPWLPMQASFAWRSFQQLAHEVVQPHVSALKIAYLVAWNHDFSDSMRHRVERIALNLREEMGGGLFGSPPRYIEHLEHVQDVRATLVEMNTDCFDYPEPSETQPKSAWFWAYSAPGRKLDDQSFWDFEGRGQVQPPSTEAIGRWKGGKYSTGVRSASDLKVFFYTRSNGVATMQPEATKLHFLTLPRETRNQIYRYLHRDLELRSIRKIGDSEVFVRLTDAPYPNVFRVHSRMNAEYKESGPTRNVAAIVFNRNHGHGGGYWTKDVETVRIDEEALFHIKSVTLRYSPNRDDPKADPVDLLTSLTRLAPMLTTIRIAECLVLQLYTDEPIPRHAGGNTQDKLNLLPDTIASLPLRQRANCRRITTRRVTEPNYPPCDEHVISQCRTHLYSAHSDVKDLWTAYDIVYGKMPMGFIEWTDHLSEESGIMFKAKHEQVVGWKEEEPKDKEKKGEEVVEATQILCRP